MGWEKRGSGLYYYQKRRTGDRVISKYVGGGALAQAVAAIDALDRERRELEWAAWRKQREVILEDDRMVDRAGDAVRALVRSWLLAQGYHTHKGQWRRKRD